MMNANFLLLLLGRTDGRMERKGMHMESHIEQASNTGYYYRSVNEISSFFFNQLPVHFTVTFVSCACEVRLRPYNG
jgi:hypothetical protein